ncbi:MAG TPA: M90 family metallopeptidase [Cytophagaceae bacterium]|nr:M90 family metallopeptidase [Cytophagaceae bacterium]
MTILAIIIFIFLVAIPVYFISRSASEKRRQQQFYRDHFPEEWIDVLNKRISYYTRLTEEGKKSFREKISKFLGDAKIIGIGVDIDNSLRLLVACSAVIPVFHFDGWRYANMGEILVYDGEVPSKEKIEGILLGQVKPFQTSHMVLLSKPSLEQGFQLGGGQRSNVGIHEFIHMVDQADGDIDGIPNALMPEELLKPWTRLMYAEIERMHKGKSDINPYGLTNHAEFFAVVSEYFFENPERFKKQHPELFEILAKVFHEENMIKK